jgi:hypothetical protein
MPTVGINGVKTPVTQGSSGMATATLPNVCKMPGPPAPFVPTPLPNIGMSGSSPQGYSTSVTIEGQPVAIQGASFNSVGDVASQGTGGGIVSSNVQGATTFIGPGSLDVKIEGKNVQLLGDPMMNNGGPSGSPSNAATMAGVVQAPASPGDPASDDSDSDETVTVQIYLLDDFGQRMANAPYKLAVGDETREGNADGDGLLKEDGLPKAEVGRLLWGDPNADAADGDDGSGDGSVVDQSQDDGGDDGAAAGGGGSDEDAGDGDPDAAAFLFDKDIYFNGAADDGDGTRLQLINLGFDGDDDGQRAAFQAAYGGSSSASDIDGAHGAGKVWPDESDQDDDDDDDDCWADAQEPADDDDDDSDDDAGDASDDAAAASDEGGAPGDDAGGSTDGGQAVSGADDTEPDDSEAS